MASKKAGKGPALDDNLDYLMPGVLTGSSEIERQGIKLTIGDKIAEGSGGAYHGKLLYMDGHTESCVAVRKRASLVEIFEVLNACSHPNIAKPIGLWEHKTEEGAGYIVFQNFYGVLSSVPKEDIFEVEGLLELKPAIYGFSKTGFNILSDIMSAVKYVNDHYQQEPTETGNSIPLKPLGIETGTIFYQLKAEGDYLVLLSHFVIDTGGNIRKDQDKPSKRGKQILSRLERDEKESQGWKLWRRTRCTQDMQQKLEQHRKLRCTALWRLEC